MIWDVCPINDEIDHLFARAEILRDIVDWHVVVEGTHTHRGEPKPFHLDGEILPPNVVPLVADLSSYTDDWARENAQRDHLVGWLQGNAEPSDLVLSCDIDEHVNPEVIRRVDAATADGPISLAMRMLYYGLDWEYPEPWLHAKAMRARDLPESLSAMRPDPGERMAWGAGWHVSYAGGEERRLAKLKMFAHAENDTDEGRDRIHHGPTTGLGPNNELLAPVVNRDGIHPVLIEHFG